MPASRTRVGPTTRDFGLGVGADIGGTFTDLVVFDEASGSVTTEKVPTTAPDPEIGVLQGLRLLSENGGFALEDIDRLVHGTTLALNTVIERTGIPTGLLVTRGFRDILNLARLRIPHPNEFTSNRPEPLVPRRWVAEIEERIAADGSVVRELDIKGVHLAASDLLAAGVRAIAVCFLHSYRNPTHEREAVAYIRRHFSGVYVSASSELWPERREYERCSVTVMNTYVGQRVESYFSRLSVALESEGTRAPLLTTKSNGGTVRAANVSPVETLFSGPAAGVVGAMRATEMISDRIMAFDMGGTSADVSIVDGRIPYSTDARAGEFPIVMPSVDISSIGAGGGSIAWCDAAGFLKVGPMSTGASPGPACYGRGGTEPTVADAYVVLGYIPSGAMLGNSITVDAASAARAVGTLGRRLGLSVTDTAQAVIDVVTAKMLAQLTPLIARRGVDPRDFALVPYGGAGPMHALFLAPELGARLVIIPPSPGVLCAWGCLAMDLSADFVRSMGDRLSRIPLHALESKYEELERQGTEWLAHEEIPINRIHLARKADVRYVGQSFELTIDIAPTLTSLKQVEDAYRTAYARTYGEAHDGEIEVVNIRLAAIGITNKPAVGKSTGAQTRGKSTRADPASTRGLVFGGDEVAAHIYSRTELPVGSEVVGPAVIDQPDCTTVIPPGFAAVVDASLNLVAARR